MRILRALMIVALVALLLVIALLLYLHYGDLNRHRERIANLAGNALGRELRLDGDIDLSLWPEIRFQSAQAVLANASWGEAPELARVDYLAVALAPGSLLSPPLRILDVELRGARLNLETRSDGSDNWTFGSDDSPAGSPSSGLPLIVEHADLEQVEVQLRQAQAPPRQLLLERATLQRGDEQLELNADGTLLDLPLVIAGGLGPPEALQELGAARFNASGRLGAMALQLDGTVEDLAALRGLTLEMDLQSDTVQSLLQAAGLDLPFSGPLQLDTSLSFDGDEVDISAMEAVLGQARVEASGRVNTSDSSGRLELHIHGSRLADALAQLPPLPFEISAAVSFDPQRLSAEDIAAQLGDSDVRGSGRATLGETPAFTAELQSRNLDLNQLLPPEPAAEEAPAGPYVFAEQDLPLAALQALKIDASLEVESFRWGAMVMRDMRLRGVAEGGDIEITQQATGAHDGSYRNHLQLRSDGRTLEATLRSKLRAIRVNIASGDDIAPDLIPPNDLTVTLSSRGASPRQLAAASNGHIHLTLGRGKVKNSAVGAFTGDILTQLFDALNPMSETEEYTDFECGLVIVDIDDGVAKLGETLLQSEKLMIVGGGRIDLNDERLNLEFNTKPREGLGLSADMFVTPFVALKGTLREPRLGVNKKGTLLTGGAAVATGGLSLLVTAALDRATAAVDHCKNTLPKYPHPDID